MADDIRSTGARQTPLSPAGESSQATSSTYQSDSTTQAIKEKTGAVWEDTRESVRSAIKERQQSAAVRVGDVAGALRTAAHDLEGRQNQSAARMVERAADSLERLSGTLRSKDLESMVKEAETFARREPALFLGAAVAAGFLAMRFLKSSSDPTHGHAHSTGSSELDTASYREGGHLH